MPRQYTPKIPRTCAHCNTQFLHHPSEIGRKYCSRTCKVLGSKKNIEDALRDYVVIANGCWVYQGARNDRGYAIVSQGRNRNVRLSRAILQRDHGVPLEARKIFACHRCDNPPCIRPDHIFPGSAAVNNADMTQKGRSATGDKNASRKHPERLARGSRHGLSKLSERDATEIRALLQSGSVSQKSLAVRYGVSPTTINRIALKKTWTHTDLADVLEEA